MVGGGRMRAAALAVLMILAVVVSAPAGAAACISAEEAQATIDATPDGSASAAHLKNKLRYGPGPFALVDFSRECVTAGHISIESRSGLWIRNLHGPEVELTIADSPAVILTNADLFAVSIAGGSARVETHTGDRLIVQDTDPVYAGKVKVRLASFENTAGFFRGSDVDTLRLAGPLAGRFYVRGVSYRILIDESS